MRVVHDSQEVPEGIDHRRGPESLRAAVSRAIVLLRPHGEQALERGLQIIDVPIDEAPGPAVVTLPIGNVLTVDDAQLVLVVAEPELNVSRPLEIRLDAEELRIPFSRRLMVGRKDVEVLSPRGGDDVAIVLPS
jgi:hypothetical protein